MNWKDYKGYKDKRGNKIDFIDGKWQMYDDGGYYVRCDSLIPDELLTIEAKKKADKEYKAYISSLNSDKKPPSLPKKMSEARLKAEVYDILHANDSERKATIKKWNEQLFGSNNQKKGVKYMPNQRKKYSSKEKAAYYVGYGSALSSYAADKTPSSERAREVSVNYAQNKDKKIQDSYKNGWLAAAKYVKKK